MNKIEQSLFSSLFFLVGFSALMRFLWWQNVYRASFVVFLLIFQLLFILRFSLHFNFSSHFIVNQFFSLIFSLFLRISDDKNFSFTQVSINFAFSILSTRFPSTNYSIVRYCQYIFVSWPQIHRFYTIFWFFLRHFRMTVY